MSSEQLAKLKMSPTGLPYDSGNEDRFQEEIRVTESQGQEGGLAPALPLSPLPLSPVPLSRADIVSAATSFLGVPFRHQGVDPETGIDCRGLLICVAERLGIQTKQEHRMNYKRKPDPAEFRAALETELVRFWERTESPTSVSSALSVILPGDVIHIFFPRDRTPDKATHAGIVAKGPYEPMLIHAFATDLGGSVIEEPLRRWEPYLAGAFRFPGLSTDFADSTDEEVSAVQSLVSA